jgi:hypothetical protein
LYQVVVAAEAFGVGQDQSILKPMVESIRDNLSSEGDVLSSALLTADTGYSSEANMQYLFEKGINAVVPDTHFRQRDKRIVESETYQQHKAHRRKTRKDKRRGTVVIPATEFVFNQDSNTCVCPAGNEMWLHSEHQDKHGKLKLSFEGKLTDCRHCALKHACMRNPASADTREGHGRQVSITVNTKRTATDWMKRRVDSELGKQIYSHRMSVVEPVFGNIGTNKGLNRFSLRGKSKVQAQWQLYCMVHNIEKVMRYGQVNQRISAIRH